MYAEQCIVAAKGYLLYVIFPLPIELFARWSEIGQYFSINITGNIKRIELRSEQFLFN